MASKVKPKHIRSHRVLVSKIDGHVIVNFGTHEDLYKKMQEGYVFISTDTFPVNNRKAEFKDGCWVVLNGITGKEYRIPLTKKEIAEIVTNRLIDANKSIL